MRKIILLACLGCAWPAFGQIAFLDSTQYLDNVGLLSGTPVGIADMNGDGLEDLIILDNRQELYIEYQQATTPFFNSLFVQSLDGPANSIAIGDVDGNGFNDIFTGGSYNALRLLKANADGSAYTTTVIDPGSYLVQGANMADIDKDGDLDLFAAHQDGLSAPFRNLGNDIFSLDYTLINPISPLPSDNSGNYGTVWADYNNDGATDLYISKYRLGVSDNTDPRRLNLLFRNDAPDGFTERALSAGLQPQAQTLATAFGDIDNDGDLDAFLINHDLPNLLYRNNGDGTFTDITNSSGIPAALSGAGLGVQAKFADFDNDGRLDLLYTSLGADHALLHNQGNATFVRVDNAVPGPGRIHSAAVGDLNQDGFLDIYAAYGTGFNQIGTQADKLLLNAGNANHFIGVALQGVESNPNGIGARVEAYGPWGQQIREIRSGESYGIHCGLRAHFGIGPTTSVDSIVVRWPNGNIDRMEQPAADSVYQITEGDFCQAQASFTSQVTGLVVSLQGQGDTGTEQYFWDFSDGAQDTGAAVIHTFPVTGTFTVCLTTEGSCGSATACQEITTQCTPPEVFFNQSADGLEVSFQDFSFGQPNEWIWDFGDGNSSGLQNPTHAYDEPGNYFVCLVVLNACGNASTCNLVQVSCGAPEAGFSADTEDLAVTFSDTSTAGTQSWFWDFGDGNTSTQQNPTHTYDEPGLYEACLAINGACGPDTACAQIGVTCPPPVASFNLTPSELTVYAETQNPDTATTYSWDFGDGTTADTTALFHTYSQPGAYEICLTTSNLCGAATLCDTVSLSCPPPQPDFEYTANNLLAQFEETSTGGATSWAWVVNSQDTLTGPDAEYLFEAPGAYEVCLTASSICGSQTQCQDVVVDCSSAPLGFAVSLDNLTGTFADTSYVQADSWVWQINGQNVGSGNNFSFNFPASGIYEVCMQNNGPCGLLSTCTTVDLSCISPVAAFASSANSLSYTFTANAPGTAEEWRWDFGDGNTGTGANAMHTYASPGTYEICLTAINPCGDSTTVCQSESVGCPAPNAAFEQEVELLSAAFFDASSNSPAQWSWEFGDGNTSTQQNPTHTYSSPGTYEVCLTAGSICGSGQFCTTLTVTCPEPQANFELETNELSIALTDLSPNAPSSWDWDFGDGNGSSSQNPAHTYESPGTYTICLVSSNTCGSNQACQEVTVSCPPPAPGFAVSPDELTVSFTDTSALAPTSWLWTFGDGSTSTQQSPAHTYSSPGTYEVCLTASSLCGSSTHCESITIDCAAPGPAFSTQPDGLAVQFSDQSTNGPSSWFWTFGNGSSATGPNPTHTFSQPGTYTVCLQAASVCGSNTACQAVEVSCPAPQAQFSFQQNELSFSFFDASAPAASAWAWDFGDGAASSLPNPTHTYDVPGVYTVCLAVSSVCGSTEFCQEIDADCSAPEANFEVQSDQLAYDFFDLSSNNPTQWAWDFGDGSTSTSQNPSHEYETPGLYTACLTASSLCGATDTCVSLNVTCNAPQSNFTFDLDELTVFFADTSANGPSTWFWTFGDGDTSSVQNPQHTYNSPGNYLVCLQVSSVCGSTQRCELITVSCTPPQANFGFSADELQVAFQDSSTADAVAWLWDFGDGQSSTASSPVHTYALPGTYEACLTVSSICGSTQHCDTVSVSCTPPWVNFDWIAEAGQVSFFQLADNTVTEWAWNFGDGRTSELPNPIHMYDTSGTYTVCLTATGLCGSNTFCDTLDITIVSTRELPAAGLRLFPNPARDWVRLFANGSLKGQVRLYNMQGQWVGEWPMQGRERLIPLSPFPPGAYLLRFIHPTYRWQQRLLILK